MRYVATGAAEADRVGSGMGSDSGADAAEEEKSEGGGTPGAEENRAGPTSVEG